MLYSLHVYNIIEIVKKREGGGGVGGKQNALDVTGSKA